MEFFSFFLVSNEMGRKYECYADRDLEGGGHGLHQARPNNYHLGYKN
jgi:hypothetical protein